MDKYKHGHVWKKKEIYCLIKIFLDVTDLKQTNTNIQKIQTNTNQPYKHENYLKKINFDTKIDPNLFCNQGK